MSHCNVSFKCGLFLIAFLLLGGCAGYGIGGVKFDKAANTHIKKIELLKIDEPKIKIYGASKWYSNPPLFGGGIVGGFLSYYMTVEPKINKRSGVFLKAKDENFVFFGPLMAKAIQQELAKIGYDVTYLDNVLPKEKIGKDVQTDADAFLFLNWSVGYDWSDKKKCFRPFVHTYISLYESRERSYIYSRGILVTEPHGGTVIGATPIEILPDEQHKYSSFDELMQNFDEAAQGIIDCLNKIAACFAEELK